jgi:penicillin V acylase-like amidase (Ntn superfamily)
VSRRLRSAGVMALLVASLPALPARACTTVCVGDEARPVVAYNYDFNPQEGLVLVNKRGTLRKSRLDPGGLAWTARYGSVTFNQFGRDNPTTGMNEKGLMVSLMWLEGTEYPPADSRPALTILEWIQHHLDTSASVADVVADAARVRPTGTTPIHYLFADATGDTAVVEFLDGQLVIHRGATLPVHALANSTYDESVRAYESAKTAGTVPASRSSLDRFVRGALLAKAPGDPVERGFAVLASVANPGRTRWSIVYDLAARVVSFRTDTNASIRRVALDRLDFSCRTPVAMLDVTAAGEGDVTARFMDYTRAANRALIDASFRETPFLASRPETERASLAAHPDTTSSCAAAD